MDPLLQLQRKVEVVKEILKFPTERDISDQSPFRHTHATISCLAIFHFQKGSYKCICCPSSFSPISMSVLPLVFSFPALQYLFQGTEGRSSFIKPLCHTHTQQNQKLEQKNTRELPSSLFQIQRQAPLTSSIFFSNMIFEGHTGMSLNP